MMLLHPHWHETFFPPRFTFIFHYIFHKFLLFLKYFLATLQYKIYVGKACEYRPLKISMHNNVQSLLTRERVISSDVFATKRYSYLLLRCVLVFFPLLFLDTFMTHVCDRWLRVKICFGTLCCVPKMHLARRSTDGTHMEN